MSEYCEHKYPDGYTCELPVTHYCVPLKHHYCANHAMLSIIAGFETVAIAQPKATDNPIPFDVIDNEAVQE